MEHVSFWSEAMIVAYWAKIQIVYIELDESLVKRLV